jgi:hypothetical protein
MDIIDVARLIRQFQLETGLMPNAVIVDENTASLKHIAGLAVITDDTATKPARVAYVLDL